MGVVTPSVVLRVMAWHINAGRPGACSDCPVTLAAREAFPRATAVRTGRTTLYFTLGGRRWELNLDEAGRRFVADFDAGRITGEPDGDGPDVIAVITATTVFSYPSRPGRFVRRGAA